MVLVGRYTGCLYGSKHSDHIVDTKVVHDQIMFENRQKLPAISSSLNSATAEQVEKLVIRGKRSFFESSRRATTSLGVAGKPGFQVCLLRGYPHNHQRVEKKLHFWLFGLDWLTELCSADVEPSSVINLNQ